MTEFAILITFFLIVFCSTIQVFLTAIEKFHLNHYAAYSARVWSVCPCTLPGGDSVQINEALAFVKMSEITVKKGPASPRKMTQGDTWRAKYLWGVHSSSLFPPLDKIAKPPWAGSAAGPIYEVPIPMIMPYSSLAMGGDTSINLGSVLGGISGILTALSLPSTLNVELPKLEGLKILLGTTFVPMDREPAEDPDKFDNDGLGRSSSSADDATDTSVSEKLNSWLDVFIPI